MLVGARPQDLSAALNVSYDDFVSCMCSSFLRPYFCTKLYLKIFLGQGKALYNPQSQVQKHFFSLTLFPKDCGSRMKSIIIRMSTKFVEFNGAEEWIKFG